MDCGSGVSREADRLSGRGVNERCSDACFAAYAAPTARTNAVPRTLSKPAMRSLPLPKARGGLGRGRAVLLDLWLRGSRRSYKTSAAP